MQLLCRGKRHRSLDDDLARLIKDLHENSFMGVSLDKDLRKVRLPISSKGRGKSGCPQCRMFP